MSEREGDPLSLFLAFVKPLGPAAPSKPLWNLFEGEETLLDAGPHSAAGVFAGGPLIRSGADVVDPPRRLLPPAA